MSYYLHHSLNQGKVGELDVKPISHWQNVDRQYWATCGLDLEPQGGDWRDEQLTVHNVNDAMVRIQHALVTAGECEDNNVVLGGDLRRAWWGGRRVCKENCRCPYHEDLLPNWGEYS